MDRIEFLHCPRIVEADHNPPRCRYTPNYVHAFEKDGPDFVYIDGPTINHPNDPQKTLLCADAVWLLEQGIYPQTILFDYRLASVRYFYRNSYRWNYVTELHYLTLPPEESAWVMGSVRHHSEFRLLSKSL